MPRNYSMDRRVAAVEETRDRIIEATMALHDQKGILATTMQDIAARAGVALGTVYRHFPTLDELVPACGGRTFERNPPPGAGVFEGLHAPGARIAALLNACYRHYSRTERSYEVGLAEAAQIPVLAGIMQETIEAQRRLVAGALAPLPADSDVVRLAVALCDFRAWQAFKNAGFSNDSAVRIASDILEQRLERLTGGA